MLNFFGGAVKKDRAFPVGASCYRECRVHVWVDEVHYPVRTVVRGEFHTIHDDHMIPEPETNQDINGVKPGSLNRW